jgi:hypothetical protein
VRRIKFLESYGYPRNIVKVTAKALSTAFSVYCVMHLRTYSNEDFVVSVSEIRSASPHGDNNCIEKSLFSDEARCSLRDSQAEGEVMVANLRAKQQYAVYCIISAVVEHCNQIVDTAVNALSHATIDSLQASGVDVDEGLLKDTENSLNIQAT